MSCFQNVITFYSNRLETLFAKLQQQLLCASDPFTRRYVIIPSLAMKSWLTFMLADRLGISMGIEFMLLHQSVNALTDKKQHGIPSQLEIALAIEIEIRRTVDCYTSLSVEEKAVWSNIFAYLQLEPNKNVQKTLTKKSIKRLIALCDRLASLFLDYDLYYDLSSTFPWEHPNNSEHELGWQIILWHNIYKMHPWINLRTLLSSIPSNVPPMQIHIFGFSHLSSLHFDFFNRYAKNCSVCHYQLSPCQLFWGDIQSDKEQKRLKLYLKQKQTSEAHQELDAYLRDNNALLANFGRLGREMTLLVENSGHSTEESYLLPQSIRSMPQYVSFFSSEASFHDTHSPLTILEALQVDMSLLRNHRIEEKIYFKNYDETIQIHIASSKAREVQILYHNLLYLIEKHGSNSEPICPGDIIVMAPDIILYEPYIKHVFGGLESQLDFQIMDLSPQMCNSAIQSLKELLTFATGRYDSAALLSLFENPLFQRRHHLNSSDIQTLRKWILQAEISWGEHAAHRNQLLQESHCTKKMAGDHEIGTWEWGFSGLLYGLAMIYEENTSSELPLDGIEFSQAELLGTFIRLFRSLREDLSCLSHGKSMRLIEWVHYIKCLFDAYYSIDHTEASEVADYRYMESQLDQLSASATLNNEVFYFATVEYHLTALFNQQHLHYRENHLQAVRFCSMLPMRTIPAKIICLLGMDEGSFPRVSIASSLDLLLKHSKNSYRPSVTDFDRYLFLETLLSTRNYLLISYSSTGPDAIPMPPSLLVTELIQYLDQAYTIQNEKISKFCTVTHPFQSFDYRYFQEEKNTGLGKQLHNYSSSDYRAAQAYYSSDKKETGLFTSSWFIEQDNREASELSQELTIDIKQLASFARNPIKTYFNKTLGIYLEENKIRELKTEERFVLSPLECHQLRQEAFKKPIQEVLRAAEQRGKLPLGTFTMIAKQHMQNEISQLQTNLSGMGGAWDQSMDITFHKGCTKVEKLTEKHWIVPAVVVEKGMRKFFLVGTLTGITTQGLIVHGKDDYGDFCKVWPQFLLLHYLPEIFLKQILLTKHRVPKKSFIENPQPHLNAYIDYYLSCLAEPSLLIPEWITDLLQHEPEQFLRKAEQMLSGHVKQLYNPYVYWMFPRGTLLKYEALATKWKQQGHQLFDPMINNW